MWTADVRSVAALGLDDPPWRWGRRGLAIDVIDKLVLAEAVGPVYDRLAAHRASG